MTWAATPRAPIRPNGFHTVVIADTDRWDSIRALADADLGPLLVSDNKPPDLPHERWTRRISASREDTGEALAALVAAELGNPAGAGASTSSTARPCTTPATLRSSTRCWTPAR